MEIFLIWIQLQFPVSSYLALLFPFKLATLLDLISQPNLIAPLFEISSPNLCLISIILKTQTQVRPLSLLEEKEEDKNKEDREKQSMQ